MSNLSVKFIEIVREKYHRLEQFTYQLICDKSGKNTTHVMRPSGEWEYYTCDQYGAEKQYRTK